MARKGLTHKRWDIATWRTVAALMVPAIYVLSERFLIPNLGPQWGFLTFLVEIWLLWPLAVDRRTYRTWLLAAAGTTFLFLILTLVEPYLSLPVWTTLALLDAVVFFVSVGVLAAWSLHEIRTRSIFREDLTKVLGWLREHPGYGYWVVVLLAALVSRYIALPAALLFVGGRWLRTGKRPRSRLSYRMRMVTLALGVLGALLLTVFMLQPLALVSWWGVEIPDAMPMPTALSYWVICVLLIFLGNRYFRMPSMTSGVKTLLVGTAVGALLTVFLAYPIYTWTYDQFVPGITYSGGAHERWNSFCLAISAVAALIAGPCAVRWGRPRRFLGKLAAGAVALGLAGVLVMTFHGLAASGVAAQAPLYDVALSRSGYEGSYWILKLAVAVNNAFAYTLIASWAGIGGAALVGGITALATPAGRNDAEDRSSWLASVVVDLASGGLGGILVIFLNVIVIAAIMSLLTDSVTNLFYSFGIDPFWKPEWSLYALLGEHWLVMVFIQVVLLFTLYLREISRDWQGDQAMIMTSYAIGIIGILLLPFVLLVGDAWIRRAGSVAALLINLFLGLELVVSLKDADASMGSTHPERDEAPFETPSRYRWSGADTIVGLFGSFVSVQFISIALTLVLVTVLMIEELTKVGAEAPGLNWLHAIFPPLMTITTFGNATLLLATVVLFVAPNTWMRLFNLVSRRWYRQIQAFAGSAPSASTDHPAWWRRPQALKAVGIVLLGVLMIIPLTTDVPTLILGLGSFLVSLLVLDSLQFEDVRWSVLLPALIGAWVAGVVSVVDFDISLQFDKTLVDLLYVVLVGPSFALAYRALRSYAGGGHPLRFRLGVFCALFPLLVGVLRYSAQEHVNIVGGLAQYDDTAAQQWRTFASDTTVLSGRMNYQFFTDRLGRFWIGGHSGEANLLIQQDDRSIPYLVQGVGAFLQETAGQGEMFLVEDREEDLWVVANTTVGRFDVQTMFTNTFTLSPTMRLPAPVADVSVAQEEIWLATQSGGAARYDLDDGSLTRYTAENSGLSADVVHAVYADRRGNVWFGTAEGLDRFDGTEWAMIRRPGLGPDVRVQAFFEDTRGDLWIGSTQGGYRVQDGAWTALDEMEGWVGDAAVSIFHEGPQGGIWAGTDRGALRFDGERWEMLAPDMAVTTFVTEDAATLWIGGRQGLLRYDVETRSSTLFNASNSGLPTDWVRDLAFGPDDKLWMSTYAEERTSGSPWWAVGLSFVVFGYLTARTYRGYERAPWVKARRLQHQVVDHPPALYPTIYDLLSEQAISMDRLLYLAVELGDAGDVRGARATVALASLEGAEDLQEALDALIRALDADRDRRWADPLARIFRILTRALVADRLTDVAALELVINPGRDVGTISLQTSETSVEDWPPFLTSDHAEAWRALERVCKMLSRYRDVEMGADRLSYLADALTSIDRAQALAETLPTPDGVLLRAVAERWRQIITEGIDAVSGRADLRVELLTPQVRRAERVTLALRLENRGRSAAERVRIVVQPSPAFALLSAAEATWPRIPPGQSETLELDVQPSDEVEVRLTCRVQWEDRTAEENRLDFADRIRFYEVEAGFEKIPNPYIVGRPVKSSEMFWGRRDLLRFIADNLRGAVQDRTLVLYGQRRTGKTSILYQLLSGHLGDEFIPVLIDMQEISLMIHSTADFLNEIAYGISRAVRRAGIGVDELDAEAFARVPVRTFSRFLDALEDRLGDRRIVVMFDEFELIEQKIESGRLEGDVLNYFRSLIQHREGLLFIFTGTHRLEEMSHDYWSILFNIALYKRVSYLKAEDARHLIRQPVAGALDVDDLVVEKILRLTHGHPYFVQLVCWALVNHCNTVRRNYATINDINAVLDEILMTGEMHFAYIWQQASRRERFALAGVARTLGPARPWARPGGVLATLEQAGCRDLDLTGLVEALDALARRGVLEMATEGALRYRYEVALLRLWVKETQSIAALLERAA